MLYIMIKLGVILSFWLTFVIKNDCFAAEDSKGDCPDPEPEHQAGMRTDIEPFVKNGDNQE